MVAAAGAAPTLGELQGFLAWHVAGYRQIQALELIEAIPKSPSGEVLRRLLRAPARAA